MESHQQAQVVVWYREAKSSFLYVENTCRCYESHVSGRQEKHQGLVSQVLVTEFTNNMEVQTNVPDKVKQIYHVFWRNLTIRLPGILINRMETLTLQSASARIPPYLP
jgi:hypothetical protein